MEIALIAKPGGTETGVGRYVAMLHQGLQGAGAAVTRVAPTLPPLPERAYAAIRARGADLRSFLLHYPLWARWPASPVVHLTSQNLALLLLLRRPRGRVVVTVHDIIPYLVRRDRRLCVYRTPADRLADLLALRGLRRADLLIADSHYTRRCLIEQLGLSPARIAVVPLGVDHTRFRPVAVPAALRERYGLPHGLRYLLYVGSEDPRKNLDTLLHGFAAARIGRPDLVLIKAGRAHFQPERARLIALAAELGVADAIRWLDDVPEADLPALYGLATVAVQPSRYEGFGLPALEAMACGTTLVCANAAALPEVAGDAGFLFAPDDPAGLAALLGRLLDDPGVRAEARQRGLARAAGFTWERTVEATSLCYSGGALR